MAYAAKSHFDALKEKVEQIESGIETNADAIRNGRKLLYGLVLPFIFSVVLPLCLYLLQSYNQSAINAAVESIQSEVMTVQSTLSDDLQTSFNTYQKQLDKQVDDYLKFLTNKQENIEMSLMALDYLSSLSAQKTQAFASWEEMKEKIQEIIAFKKRQGSDEHIDSPHFAYIIYLAMEYLTQNKDKYGVMELYKTYEYTVAQNLDIVVLLLNYYFKDILATTLITNQSSELQSLDFFKKLLENARVYNVPEKTVPLEMVVTYTLAQRKQRVNEEVRPYIDAMRRVSAYKRIEFLFTIYKWSDPLFFTETVSGQDVLVARKVNRFIEHFRENFKQSLVDAQFTQALKKLTVLYGDNKRLAPVYQRIMDDFGEKGASSFSQTLMAVQTEDDAI